MRTRRCDIIGTTTAHKLYYGSSALRSMGRGDRKGKGEKEEEKEEKPKLQIQPEKDTKASRVSPKSDATVDFGFRG